MKYIQILSFALLVTSSFALTSCSAGRDGSYSQQGVKLEDAQNKDMMHNSPLPNGSPDIPPSEISASPTGSSLGDAPVP